MIDKSGLSLNAEVWDTSVALIAILKSGMPEFNTQISQMKTWLRNACAYSEDNYNQEPWETLWAIYAMLHSSKINTATSNLIRNSILWVLNRRSRGGILISQHYVGLLLSVLSILADMPGFSPRHRAVLNEAKGKSIRYLWDDFIKNARNGVLWTDEPWSIGLILDGLAKSGGFGENGSRPIQSDDIILKWCGKNWDSTNGWEDVLDTACLLIGLSELYIKKEMTVRRLDPADRLSVVKNISSQIEFAFRNRRSSRMVLFPIWSKRNFRLRQKACCILMPYSQPWSNRLRKILKEVLSKSGFSVTIVDELYNQDIIDDIWTSINEASIVIADCTGKNANVFYELGVAQTIGKDVVLITQRMADIPFDIQTQRVIPYNLRNVRKILTKTLLKRIEKIMLAKI